MPEQGRQATALVRDTWGRAWAGIHTAHYRARNIDPHGVRLVVLTFEDGPMRARGALKQMMRSVGEGGAEPGARTAPPTPSVVTGGAPGSASAASNAPIQAAGSAGRRGAAGGGPSTTPKKPKALAHSHGDHAANDAIGRAARGGGSAASDLVFCEGESWWLQLIVATLSGVLLVSWSIAACFAWRGSTHHSRTSGVSPDVTPIRDAGGDEEQAHAQSCVLSHATSRMTRNRKPAHT